MKTIRPTALALTLTVCLAPLAAQSHGPLPPNRTHVVAGQLGRFQIQKMLQTGLNSAGDTMRLELRLSASVPIVALVNAGSRLHLTLDATRVAADAYELSMTAEQAATLGLEVMEGLEINAVSAMSRRVVFAFDSAASAARGLDLISQLGSIGVRSLHKAASAQWELVQSSARLVRAAVLSLQDTAVVEQARLRSYQAAQAGLRNLERGSRRTSSKIGKIKRRLRHLDRKIRRTPRWLRKPLRRTRRAASRSLGGLQRALHRTARNISLARRGLATKRHAWVESKKKVDLERSALATKRQAEKTSRETLDSMKAVLDATTAPLLRLAKHTAGIELGYKSGVEVEAAINPLGISVKNFGMGASAASYLGAKLRWDFERPGHPTRITILGYRSLSYCVWAGAVVGAEANAGAALEIEVAFARPHGGRFAFEKGHTTLLTDISVVAVAGFGAVAKHGIGQQIAVTMTMRDWLAAIRASGSMVKDPTPENLIRGLDKVGATFRAQSRWIGALEAEVGASYAGGGFSIGGGATWEDRGAELSKYVTAGEVLRRVLDQKWAPTTAKNLGALLPR